MSVGVMNTTELEDIDIESSIKNPNLNLTNYNSSGIHIESKQPNITNNNESNNNIKIDEKNIFVSKNNNNNDDELKRNFTPQYHEFCNKVVSEECTMLHKHRVPKMQEAFIEVC